MSLAASLSFETWRSILFVSPLADKHLEKAPLAGADALQLDLEDAIPADRKIAARERLGPVITDLRRAGVRDIIVRVNAPWLLAVEDLRAAVAAGADCITLPKVEGAHRAAVVDTILDEIEDRQAEPLKRTRILIMIESALGLENLPDILRASNRICAVTLGPEDFARDMGTAPTMAANEWANLAVLAAGRAAGVTPLGFPGSIALIDDMDRFRAQISRAAELGFRGAAVIHPKQVAVLNALFAPTAENLAEAEHIVFAAQSSGAGVLVVDGKMVDAPVIERARALLNRHRALDLRKEGPKA